MISLSFLDCSSDPPPVPQISSDPTLKAEKVVTPQTQTTAPYPYNTKVTYTCPCGFRWKQVSMDGITVNSVASRTVDVLCRGIIGFKYPFSVSECIPGTS